MLRTPPRPILIGAGMLAIAGAATLVATGPAGPQAGSAHGGQNQPAQPGQEGRGDIGAMLVRGLQATEGCLGVETASTAGGKNLIMAWFEDAEAARRWYSSPVHMRMVGMFGGEPKEKALEHVADGAPVLVIASLTMAEGDQRIPGSPMPISQIAIELYTTLPGGAFVNGRLAPEALHVEHMTDHTPDAAPPAPAPASAR